MKTLGPYIPLPEGIMQFRISIYAKVLYAWLKWLADNDGQCKVRLRIMQQWLGLAERRTRIVLRELTAMRLRSFKKQRPPRRYIHC
jgi:hypothetical protein